MHPTQLIPALRRAPLFFACAVLAGCAGPRAELAAGDPQQLPGTPGPLPMADCLDPDRARSFVLLDSNVLLVDAGRRHYYVRLAHACTELGTTHALEFRPAGGIGRLCGGSMETVLAVGGRPPVRPWPISAISLLDEAQYQALRDGGSVTASGTIQPQAAGD